MDEMDRFALRLPCPRCKQPVGKWCVTVKGRRPGYRAAWLHVSRTELIWEVYLFATKKARHGLVGNYLTDPEWFKQYVQRVQDGEADW